MPAYWLNRPAADTSAFPLTFTDRLPFADAPVQIFCWRMTPPHSAGAAWRSYRSPSIALSRVLLPLSGDLWRHATFSTFYPFCRAGVSLRTFTCVGFTALEHWRLERLRCHLCCPLTLHALAVLGRCTLGGCRADRRIGSGAIRATAVGRLTFERFICARAWRQASRLATAVLLAAFGTVVVWRTPDGRRQPFVCYVYGWWPDRLRNKRALAADALY